MAFFGFPIPPQPATCYQTGYSAITANWTMCLPAVNDALAATDTSAGLNGLVSLVRPLPAPAWRFAGVEYAVLNGTGGSSCQAATALTFTPASASAACPAPALPPPPARVRLRCPASEGRPGGTYLTQVFDAPPPYGATVGLHNAYTRGGFLRQCAGTVYAVSERIHACCIPTRVDCGSTCSQFRQGAPALLKPSGA
jgi:hypothetical protein